MMATDKDIMRSAPELDAFPKLNILFTMKLVTSMGFCLEKLDKDCSPEILAVSLSSIGQGILPESQETFEFTVLFASRQFELFKSRYINKGISDRIDTLNASFMTFLVCYVESVQEQLLPYPEWWTWERKK